jgi:hypothetical protein
MWDWAIWGALVVAGTAGSAALALVVTRARQAWRGLEAVRRDIVGRLDELAAAGEATAEKVATAGETAELERSVGRLRLSLARLAVLRAAIDDVQDTFGHVTAVIPRR